MPKLIAALTAASLLACKHHPDEPVVTPVMLPEPPVERFDRMQFPCVDSLQGVWRVHKYTAWGRTEFPERTGNRVLWGIQADTIRLFRADTLIFKQYAQIERLTPNHRRPGGGRKFSHRINTSHDRDPSYLQGYYAMFYADSLFLHGSYSDGPDYWLVRDCN